MSTKNVNNYKLKTFRDIFGQKHTQEFKAKKKQIIRFQLNLDPSTSFCCTRKEKKRFLIFKNSSGDKVGFS